MLPPRPPNCDAEIEAATAEWRGVDVGQGGPHDMHRELRVTWTQSSAEWRAIFARQAEALAAWETECDRLREASGLADADAERDRLGDELVAAAHRLALTYPMTLAGLAAKASAWLAIHKSGNGGDWSEELAETIVREVIMLAGILAPEGSINA